MKLEKLIGSIQTFEATVKEPTKKKGIALKVEEPSKLNEDSDDELTLVAKRFKKLFRRNTKDYSKNKQLRKSYPGYKKKNDFFKEPPIFYECKGSGHIAKDCGNKKNKYKSKGKAMVATWDEESETLEHESQSSEEAPSQDINAFMAFETSMSSLLETSDLSEDEGEYEEEGETYDAQEAFEDLFVQSVELEKKNKQLKKEIIELTEKLNSLENTISSLKQDSYLKTEKEKDLSKENYLFLCEKEEMSL